MPVTMASVVSRYLPICLPWTGRESVRVSRIRVTADGKSGCCHNKRHSLACFEPESWLLANGDLEELGKETTAQLEEEE